MCATQLTRLVQDASDASRVPIVWFAQGVLDAMSFEAEQWYPRETGGVLLGYSDESSREIVVRTMVGPGPEARHGRWTFVPDHRFHEDQVSQIYARSGRTWTYLGDWHSHPDGPLRMSIADRRTLARIARFGAARVPRPLMAILAGRPGQVNEFAQGSRDSAEGLVLAQHGWRLAAWRVAATPTNWQSQLGIVDVDSCTLREFG